MCTFGFAEILLCRMGNSDASVSCKLPDAVDVGMFGESWTSDDGLCVGAGSLSRSLSCSDLLLPFLPDGLAKLSPPNKLAGPSEASEAKPTRLVDPLAEPTESWYARLVGGTPLVEDGCASRLGACWSLSLRFTFEVAGVSSRSTLLTSLWWLRFVNRPFDCPSGIGVGGGEAEMGDASRPNFRFCVFCLLDIGISSGKIRSASGSSTSPSPLPTRAKSC